MNNFYLNYKSPITIALFIILAGGLYFFSKMQTTLLPEISFPKIKIIADNGEQPVDKMMISVTKPLENAIKKVPGLTKLRSKTSRGSCEISAFMTWNSDIDLRKQQVEASIAQIRNELPPELDIKIEKMSPSILPVMGFSLESDTKSPIELRMIAEYTVKPVLSRVEGVSSIAVIGGKIKEYQIILNPKIMTELSITPDMIMDALNKTNFIASNGYLNDYRRLYLTLTDATVKDISEIKDLVIKNNINRIVKLRDIADVKVGEKKDYVKINANGKDVPLIAVIKQPESNLLNVCNGINDKTKELSKLLPKDVKLRLIYNQADFVSESIKSIIDVLWVGLLLSIIVTIIFLRSIKASSVVLITIPLILSLTLTVLYSLGFTFNIMTLGAIAASIGLIIDDAIVVVEQIHRTHEENPEVHSKQLVQKAIKYLLPAMVGSSLSTIVIFIPFLLMSGVAGSYFKVMTNTMIITLICSFIITWIGLPVIYLLFSKKGDIYVDQPKEKHLKRQTWVSFFIEKPYISIALILILVLAFFLTYNKLETGFLPEMDEGTIVLDYSTPPGTSLDETVRILNEVEKIIVSTPEVESYSRRTGTEMGFFITEPNTGDYLIQIKKKRGKTTEDVIDVIRKRIEASQPVLRVDFGQVVSDMLGDLMSSVQPIEIKIFGRDQETLNQLATKAAEISSKVEGAADIFNGIVIAGPDINIYPDFDKLSQYGISPQNFQSQLQTSLEGNIAGTLKEAEQMTNIRLLYPRHDSMNLENLKQSPIFLPDGSLRQVQEFSNAIPEKGVAEIQRENLQSMVAITGRLNNRDLGSVIGDIRKNLKSKLFLPAGYQIEYGGAYEQQQKSFEELLVILFTACLLVFTVILFLFKDFKIAFIILLIGLLGSTGSCIALYLTGTPLNVGSYTGIIMIVGIIGENAIFTFLQYKKFAETKSRDESIIYSISTRLRPKLMTALGAIVALSPLALGIGPGAQLHQPLAIAVIGGFVIAMPLLLIVLPTAIKLLYKKEE